ncbi:MAG TPA: YidC/Oxa1 family membrane protein insertase [Gemmatimonadaceae bacterium]|nr:YidC/Oxa1 family membrane protein insertase [Gemmatimonadaceae bacterium]
MLLWSLFLELLRVVLFAFAHVCGGSLGGGIVILSLIIRLALLPLTLRLAVRAHEYGIAIRKLTPALEVLRKRHRKDRVALAVAEQKLRAEHGLGLAPKGTLLGAVVQMPIGSGIYQTIAGSARRAAHFLWIRDLSRPDALVASVAAGLAGAAVVAGPSSTSSRVGGALAAGVTFLVAWRLSAGLGLYWVASNVVGVVQSLLVRRAVARAPSVPNK